MGTDLGFGRLPEGTGASADADQALVSDQAASRLDPAGFDPSRLRDLAQRCVQATGPSFVLDCDIWDAIYPDGRGLRFEGRLIPAFTASLDAAMKLVPEGANFVIVREGDAISASVPIAGSRRSSVAFAATPALALCAAALRALGDNS